MQVAIRCAICVLCVCMPSRVAGYMITMTLVYKLLQACTCTKDGEYQWSQRDPTTRKPLARPDKYCRNLIAKLYRSPIIFKEFPTKVGSHTPTTESLTPCHTPIQATIPLRNPNLKQFVMQCH